MRNIRVQKNIHSPIFFMPSIVRLPLAAGTKSAAVTAKLGGCHHPRWVGGTTKGAPSSSIVGNLVVEITESDTIRQNCDVTFIVFVFAVVRMKKCRAGMLIGRHLSCYLSIHR